MDGFLDDPALAPHRLRLTCILRYRPHTLGEKEEKLLAMQTEMAQAASHIFRQLNDADLSFGPVETTRASRSNSATAASSRCSTARTATSARRLFTRYYGNTLPIGTRWPQRSAAIERDIYYAKARNYPCALEAALFPDQVPPAVYDNLIAAIHRQLPALHHYYDVRRRKMRLDGDSPLRHLRADPGRTADAAHV